ncbi:MAG: hypothetical protein ACPG5B_14135 [Chitinophagales bacterium]
MNKTILFIIINIFYLSLLKGQNESVKTNKFILMEGGFQNEILKNKTFSALKFQGIIPSIRFGYEARKDTSIWSSNLNILYGSINYNNEFFPSDFIDINLNVNYVTKVFQTKKARFFVGGQFSSTIQLFNYDDFSNGSWQTTQTIDFLFKHQYIINSKHVFSSQMSYPLLGLASVPKYGGLDEFVVVNSDNIPKILYSRMSLFSLHSLFNPKIEIAYEYHRPKIGVRASSTYQYFQINSIKKYYRNSIGFHLALMLKIGRK